MSFDSVFNGDPTTPNVSASGEAAFGIDLATGQLYYRNPQDSTVAGWQECAGSGGSVTSDNVANESEVSGTTVTDALNTLNSVLPNVVIRARVTLTAAQILNNDVSPTTIIAAPSESQFINVIGASAVYNFVTTPYTISDSGENGMIFGFPGEVGFGNSMLLAGFLDQSSSQFATGFIGTGAPAPAPLTDVAGLPLTLQFSAAVTDGDGTLDCFVSYTIESV